MSEGELMPSGGKPKMTRSQVKKYIKNMKQAQKIAKEKIKKMKEAGDLEQSDEEIKKLENQIDEAFE
ncbi:hypothetical protein HGA92_01100 [Candidatus Gracilibacteria bacterium]|nr:hypothetical protein [Candidatus Gracilibacteria bacterium]NUJ98794.1 hypothetical protein [Candidatus Gracilibacteria bacterium]